MGLEKGTAVSTRQNWTLQKPCTPCHQHTQGWKTHPGTIIPCEGGSSGKQMLRQFEVQEVYLWKMKERGSRAYISGHKVGGGSVKGRGEEAGLETRQDAELAVSISSTRWSRANAAHWRNPTLDRSDQAPTPSYSVPVKQNIKTQVFPKGIPRQSWMASSYTEIQVVEQHGCHRWQKLVHLKLGSCHGYEQYPPWEFKTRTRRWISVSSSLVYKVSPRTVRQELHKETLS